LNIKLQFPKNFKESEVDLFIPKIQFYGNFLMWEGKEKISIMWRQEEEQIPTINAWLKPKE